MREEIRVELATATMQSLEEHMTELSLRQAEVFERLKEELAKVTRETTDTTVKNMVQEALRKRRKRDTDKLPAKVRSITEASSRRQATSNLDSIIWPLLNSGMTVRAIAAQAVTSTATVGSLKC
jgi:hypothetical protein